MNITSIAGRIGQDATTRTAGETTVTSFSVADDYRAKGEKMTRWWDCQIWGQRGTALEQYLTKGSPVTVVGEASVRQYEKDGEQRVSLECRVLEVALQGGKSEGDRAPAQRQAPVRAPQRSAPSSNDFADDDIDKIPF